MNDWSKEDFGIRLKALREQRGLSMMAFGAAIGTSASRIKDWEKGKNAPSAAWIAKISERFTISTDELILGDPKTSRAFTPSGTSNVDMLYERLRENLIIGKDDEKQDAKTEELYNTIDAENKERYRSGRGRRLAERELLTLLTELPKKDLLELLEVAKIKKRWL